MNKLFFALLIIIMAEVGASGQAIRAIKLPELEHIIATSKKPLVVNFWATWCPPCVKEIPYFQKQVAAHHDSIDLILVSMDFSEAYPDTIRATMRKRGFTAPVYWLNETNADYFCPRIEKNWYGGLPSTLFINSTTGYRKFIDQQIEEEQLKGLLKELLH